MFYSTIEPLHYVKPAIDLRNDTGAWIKTRHTRRMFKDETIRARTQLADWMKHTRYHDDVREKHQPGAQAVIVLPRLQIQVGVWLRAMHGCKASAPVWLGYYDTVGRDRPCQSWRFSVSKHPHPIPQFCHGKTPTCRSVIVGTRQHVVDFSGKVCAQV